MCAEDCIMLQVHVRFKGSFGQCRHGSDCIANLSTLRGSSSKRYRVLCDPPTATSVAFKIRIPCKCKCTLACCSVAGFHMFNWSKR